MLHDLDAFCPIKIHMLKILPHPTCNGMEVGPLREEEPKMKLVPLKEIIRDKAHSLSAICGYTRK